MNPILLDLPMPIWTPRLCIKPRFAGEGPALNRVICTSLEHLKPWMPFAQHAPTLEESEEHCRRSVAKFILREDLTLSIYTRDGKTLIGSTGFHQPNWELRSFHIGYWVAAEFEGQGFITESTNALTRYGFEVLRARRLEIRCDEGNASSFGVMDRLGYVREGTLKHDSFSAQGEVRSTIVTARCDSKGLPPLDVKW
ncbi:MAG TPA: GNAT family N-acetyltransferase [Bdellovibrionota bacterium]|jgi:RimJ/RimL family protein N-acetyltransferase|nr:GNAT family N-acetyltransferase [Bdellovibrionota bacterium]